MLGRVVFRMFEDVLVELAGVDLARDSAGGHVGDQAGQALGIGGGGGLQPGLHVAAADLAVGLVADTVAGRIELAEGAGLGKEVEGLFLFLVQLRILLEVVLDVLFGDGTLAAGLATDRIEPGLQDCTVLGDLPGTCVGLRVDLEKVLVATDLVIGRGLGQRLETVFAEILQAPGFGAMARFAALGKAVDTAVGHVLAGQRVTVLVKTHYPVEHLAGTEGRVRVLVEIADLFLQCILHPTLVAKVFQQRVVIDDVLGRAPVTLGQFPDDAGLFRRITALAVLAHGVHVLQFTLEVLPTILAEVLQAPGLGTMPGVTAFGETIDAAVVDGIAGQACAVFVEAFDMLQHLIGPVGRVRIVFEIADPFAQLVLHPALVAEVFQQWAAVDDVLGRASVILGPLPLDAGVPGLGPIDRVAPFGAGVVARDALDRGGVTDR
ncbi:hypothetical protein ALQ17_05334 [Pseudomonas fluorescens]|nr:hypothetical protein ALQ17_05334 [Pseudomonas fluorescens]